MLEKGKERERWGGAEGEERESQTDLALSLGAGYRARSHDPEIMI